MINDIKAFAVGEETSKSPMHIRIYNEFLDLKKQRNGIQKSIKDLSQMIKELETKPQDSSYDEQIKELKAERGAWSKIVKNINEKDVFNFLSDSRLLPNYAFPEAGIVLKAIVTRVDKDEENEGKKKYTPISYEFNRAASSAISEFAPLNTFYAGGHKLTIDQVDMNTAKAEPWKLCPNCSHACRMIQDAKPAVRQTKENKQCRDIVTDNLYTGITAKEADGHGMDRDGQGSGQFYRKPYHRGDYDV